MGAEILTFVALGATIAGGVQQMEAAEDAAAAEVRRGDIEADNTAKRVRRQAGQAKTSFLSSGLELSGTPMAAIESIFDTGLEDINLIQSNSQSRAKNIISDARSGFITSLGTSVLSAGMGGGFSAPGITNFGQTATATFAPDFVGPVQPLF